MRLSFSTLGGSLQKTRGQVGTLGTCSNGAAFERPQIAENLGDKWGQPATNPPGESSEAQELSPVSPECPPNWGRPKPSNGGHVPSVPRVPQKKETNQIAEKTRATVATVAVANPEESKAHTPESGGAAFASWRVTFPDGTETTTTSYPPSTLAQMQEVYRNGEHLEPIMPEPDDDTDNRITCQQCSNLTASGACRVARPGGEVSANRGYKPNATTLHRCSAYLPGADDPDQRPAAIRWPGLTTRKEAR